MTALATAIPTMVNTLADTGEDPRAAEDELDVLFSLARTRGNLFQAQIRDDLQSAGSTTDKGVPVRELLATRTYLYAFSSTKCDIVKEVGKAVGDLLAFIVRPVHVRKAELDLAKKQSELKKIKAKGRVHAYCLMTNHPHLAMRWVESRSHEERKEGLLSLCYPILLGR